MVRSIAKDEDATPAEAEEACAEALETPPRETAPMAMTTPMLMTSTPSHGTIAL